MIERNLLDQTKDLRPPQRDVQSNFGMLTEEQRRIAEQGLSQNERVGSKAIGWRRYSRSISTSHTAA
jgi:hypothetical protein